jgi:hypothetical protein
MRDTIDMAREAGFDIEQGALLRIYLDHFAELVRADERDACAKVCEDAAEDGSEMDGYDTAYNCAAAIRARGNT